MNSVDWRDSTIKITQTNSGEARKASPSIMCEQERIFH